MILLNVLHRHVNHTSMRALLDSYLFDVAPDAGPTTNLIKVTSSVIAVVLGVSTSLKATLLINCLYHKNQGFDN